MRKTLIIAGIIYTFSFFFIKESLFTGASWLLSVLYYIFFIGIFVLLGYILALFLSVWYKGNYEERLYKAFKLGLLLSPVCFFSSYFGVVIYSMI
jgi:hypothetical protein